MLHPDIRKRTSEMDGHGLFAARPVPRGTIVWSSDDGDARLVVTHRQLRALPPHVHHLAYRNRDRFILCFDGSQFMNHSCDPNLAWADDDHLVAVRDIAEGEEVTFDYATSETHPWWRPKWVCRCGSPACRRVISGRDCLDATFQERYRGRLPSWVTEFIAQQRGWRGWSYARLFGLAERLRRARGYPTP